MRGVDDEGHVANFVETEDGSHTLTAIEDRILVKNPGILPKKHLFVSIP